MLQAVERGGNFADVANRVASKPIDAQTVNWWKSYWEYISKVRNQLYGATLTSNEQADFERFTITPATTPEIAKLYFTRQRKVLDDAIKRKQGEALGALKAQTPEELVGSLSGAGGSRIPTVNTQAEFDAVPPGGEYIDAQTGKRAKKPMR
jgi:hypothetical protein